MTDAIVFEKSTYGSMILPVMSLREVVMFPKSIVPLFVGRDSSIKAIEMALDKYEKRIFLVAQKDPGQERPDVDGLFAVGTVSKVLQMLRLPDGTIKVLFEGLYRASWDHERGLMTEDDIQMVRTIALPDTEGNLMEGEALVRATHEAVEEYSQVNRKLAKETILAITSVSQPGRLADSIAPHLKATYDRKQGVLELRNPVRRLERVYELIQEEVEVFSLEKKIKGRVKKQMEENQKDYYLGEQLKAIHKEMGRDFDPKADMEEFEVQLKDKDMPEEARAKAMAEMKKLRQTPPSSAEYAVLRNYVDWILALPWNVVRGVDIDIKQAQKILDDDHYGLEKPKERILEYLAVQALVKKLRGPILCLVGPPGVGKTSLAKSIARATGREFVRLSLGGVNKRGADMDAVFRIDDASGLARQANGHVAGRQVEDHFKFRTGPFNCQTLFGFPGKQDFQAAQANLCNRRCPDLPGVRLVNHRGNGKSLSWILPFFLLNAIRGRLSIIEVVRQNDPDR